MILYMCFGWTEDPRSMTGSCRARRQAESMSGSVYGRYGDGAWWMHNQRPAAGGGTLYERDGEDPALVVELEGPGATCEGAEVTRWAYRAQGKGPLRYCWARHLGYAYHVRPRTYLLK